MCCSKGFFKRIVPFIATFALGLLIASFFVTVAAPNFRFGRGFRHRDLDRQMRAENERLRDENFRLKQQNVENGVQTDADVNDVNELVPPPPPIAPVAPRSAR